MQQHYRTVILAVLALVFVSPDPASAQLGKLKDKLKQKVDQKVDCTLDKYIDSQECVAARKEAEKKSSDGAATTAESSAKAASMKPGEGAWANFDFVPGERVIFYTDFSNEQVGNFPRVLDLENGALEVVEWPANSGKFWLRTSKDETRFRIPLPEVLPTKFTMEFDMTIPWWGGSLYATDEKDAGASEHGRIEMSGSRFGYMRGDQSGLGSYINPGDKFPGTDWDVGYATDGPRSSERPFRVRIAADGKYMKVYLDEVRVSNIPNSEFGRAKHLVFTFGGGSEVLISNISVNAGGKTMYDALTSTGRLALQGIYFDTGKDIIRPESSGTLNEIAKMMKAHPELKLAIEGHTDNVGNAASNKSLSERRAAAVKAALVSTYGVSEASLTSAGLGDTKPVAPNDTPEGKQKNRRVELVVQK